MNTQYNIARHGRGKEIFAFCGTFRKYGWKYMLVMYEVCELDDVYQSETGMVDYVHDRPVKIDRNTYEAIRRESLKCKKIMDRHSVSMEAIYNKYNNKKQNNEQ